MINVGNTRTLSPQVRDDSLKNNLPSGKDELPATGPGGRQFVQQASAPPRAGLIQSCFAKVASLSAWVFIALTGGSPIISLYSKQVRERDEKQSRQDGTPNAKIARADVEKAAAKQSDKEIDLGVRQRIQSPKLSAASRKYKEASQKIIQAVETAIHSKNPNVVLEKMLDVADFQKIRRAYLYAHPDAQKLDAAHYAKLKTLITPDRRAVLRAHGESMATNAERFKSIFHSSGLFNSEIRTQRERRKFIQAKLTIDILIKQSSKEILVPQAQQNT